MTSNPFTDAKPEFAPTTTPCHIGGRLFEFTEADWLEVDGIAAALRDACGAARWRSMIELFDVACYVFVRRTGRRGAWVRK